MVKAIGDFMDFMSVFVSIKIACTDEVCRGTVIVVKNISMIITINVNDSKIVPINY